MWPFGSEENCLSDLLVKINYSSFLNDSKDLNSKVLVPLSPCEELFQKPWTFWKNNSIILMPQTKSIASHLNMNLNSRIYFLDSDEKLYEVFKYSPQDQDYSSQEIGSTNAKEFLNIVTYIWDRRTDLKSIHLNIVYVDDAPFTIKHNGSQVRGYHGEVFHSLQEKLKFKYSTHFQKDKVFGVIGEDGHYNGMLGKIQRGDANWSISDWTETEERAQTFDFGIPILNLPKRIVTRRQGEGFNSTAYLSVFSQQFWICILVSAVILIFCVYWILRFDKNLPRLRLLIHEENDS